MKRLIREKLSDEFGDSMKERIMNRGGGAAIHTEIRGGGRAAK